MGVEKFGETVKLNPKVAKTALEGMRVPWEYTESAITKLQELKNKGIQVVSLELTPNSVDYKKAEYKLPLCLVVGHEREGVSNKVNQIADLVIQIPMQGKGKSLNVSVATAIALFNLT